MNNNNNKNERKFVAIMVLGPPGAGKGTQARMIAKKFGYYHFITSKIGREYIKTHTDPETLKQKDRYDKGLLFDYEWLFRVIKEKTTEIAGRMVNIGGIVYDGSPRTLYEAEHLFSFLTNLIGRENIKVVEIDVGEKELLNRLKNRLICTKSSAHIFIRSNELKPGVGCPEAGCPGLLAEKDLDKEDVFKVRISEFRKHTMPGIEFLRRNHNVIVVDGEKTTSLVHRDIMKRL